jgi:hypothetical protein
VAFRTLRPRMLSLFEELPSVVFALVPAVPVVGSYYSCGDDRRAGRTGQRPYAHTSRTLQPTASMTSSLFVSITLTSVSLHTKVVIRMLVSGVRNFT